MSLPALALLLTATNAIREYARERGALDGPDPWLRVEMSPREPLVGLEGSRQILIAVFLGDQTHKVEGRRLFGGGWQVELAIQVLLPPLAVLRWDDEIARVDAHTAGSVFAFTSVRQMIDLALGAAPKRPEAAGGSWGELYRALVTKHASDFTDVDFLASAGKVEVPGRDISVELHTIDAPTPGDVEVQSSGFWADLVAKMRTEPRLADTADFVAALIRGDVLAPWQVERTRAGLSGAEAEALGLGPFPGLDEEPATVGLTIVGDRGTTRITAEEAP